MDSCLPIEVTLAPLRLLLILHDRVSSGYDADSSSRIIDEVEWHNETSPGTVHYFRDETGERERERTRPTIFSSAHL